MIRRALLSVSELHDDGTGSLSPQRMHVADLSGEDLQIVLVCQEEVQTSEQVCVRDVSLVGHKMPRLEFDALLAALTLGVNHRILKLLVEVVHLFQDTLRATVRLLVKRLDCCLKVDSRGARAGRSRARS